MAAVMRERSMGLLVVCQSERKGSAPGEESESEKKGSEPREESESEKKGSAAKEESDSAIWPEESDSAIWSNADSTDTDGTDTRRRNRDTPNR